MAEFKLYIRNIGDGKTNLSTNEHMQFVAQCEVYIQRLQSQGKLIAAQPLEKRGIILSKEDNAWTTTNMATHNEIQVGYYHIIANDIEEAIAIAKENPEFTFVPGASIEIRPIKTKENNTNFVYPNSL
jgi:hypothetical protein